MLDNLILVATQTGVLFALMALGFVCNKTKFIDEKAVKAMVALLVSIVTPALIIHAFNKQLPFEPAKLTSLLEAFGLAIAVHLLVVALGRIAWSRSPDRVPVMRFGATFSNAGFMGIPLEYAILGEEGVFYGSMYIAVFNVFCWSYGLAMMAGSSKDVRVRQMVLNPGMIGIILGLPLFAFSYFFPGFHLPVIVADPIKMVADLNTPLAMLVIGYYLAESDLGKVFRCGSAYTVTVLRLLVAPMLVIGFIYLVIRLGWRMDPVLAKTVAIAASAPVAALSTVLAVRYNRDVSLSVGLVAATTLLSILTMPPIIAFALSIF